MLEGILRYLIGKYGAQVIDWTLGKIFAVWQEDGGDGQGACMQSDVAAWALAEMKKGYNLDPDSGVYFWELPRKEQ